MKSQNVRVCLRKFRHATREDAEAEARKIAGTKPPDFPHRPEVFRCHICDGFHVGKATRTKFRPKRRRAG